MADDPLDFDQGFTEWVRSIGGPISQEGAVVAVLRLINSDLAETQNVKATGQSIADCLSRLDARFDGLSGGEKKLANIAETLWHPNTASASIAVFGGLDKGNRRRVLMILMAYYLGNDIAMDEARRRHSG